MPEPPIELIQGTLELLILRTLDAGPPKHGFDILEWIFNTTDEALDVEEGSLYPALHRMEKRGLIEASWAVSPKGRRAKYYELTAAGNKELRARAAHWDAYVTAVDKLSTGEAS